MDDLGVPLQLLLGNLRRGKKAEKSSKVGSSFLLVGLIGWTKGKMR